MRDWSLPFWLAAAGLYALYSAFILGRWQDLALWTRVHVSIDAGVSGEVQVWYMGGPGGNEITGAIAVAGPNPWHVAAVADFIRCEASGQGVDPKTCLTRRRVVSQKVTILGYWNSRKARSPLSLSSGEERAKILLARCIG